MGMVILTYGFLSTFVLSGASRNRRNGVKNPKMMEWVGYVLVGVSIGVSLGLFYAGLMGIEVPLDVKVDIA